MAKTYVQATLGVGSVNFRAVDFGGALFNWFNWFFCVLRVLSDTWGLRCTMFIFWVKEADWGMIAFSPILPLGFQNLKPCVSACPTHSVARGHHPCPGLVLSISGHLPLLGQGVRACACVRACVCVYLRSGRSFSAKIFGDCCPCALFLFFSCFVSTPPPFPASIHFERPTPRHGRGTQRRGVSGSCWAGWGWA